MTGEQITLGIAFLAGLVSFVSPCVLPVVPSYLTFITGVTLGDLRDPQQSPRLWRRALLHSVMFVLGFSLVFILAIGGLVGVLQRALAGYSAWVYRIGGVIIIVLGLYFAGLLPFRFLDAERRLQLRKKPLGYFGSLLVGVLFAAGWTPCVGPVLGSIIALASASQVSGFLMLSAYSAGLAFPFLACSMALNTFFASSGRLKKHLKAITMASGLLLALIGLLMVVGAFQWLVSRAG